MFLIRSDALITEYIYIYIYICFVGQDIIPTSQTLNMGFEKPRVEDRELTKLVSIDARSTMGYSNNGDPTSMQWRL